MADLTPESIMAEVKAGKPYTLVVLKKGPNFDSTAHLQMEHLKHIFTMRHAGQQLITIPIMDLESELAGIGLFATADKEEAARLTAADPAVVAGRLTFEILGCMALPGDAVK
jgi:uncharacterized protein YciI